MTQRENKITLICERKIAYDSPDHIQPEGTRRDNSINKIFNDYLYRLYGCKQLKILDLGCAGGGFVKTCLDDGHFAIGLEGSDYSKKFKRAEWRTIPDNLFTCDVTKPFQLYENKKEIKFDVITCWEIMEHLTEKGINGLMQNIKKILNNNGIWIISVSCFEWISNEIRIHQTVKPKSWWLNKFKENGFIIREDFKRFFNNNFVRTDGDFILILALPDNQLAIPKKSKKKILWEMWLRNPLHKILKIIITGENY